MFITLLLGGKMVKKYLLVGLLLFGLILVNGVDDSSLSLTFGGQESLFGEGEDFQEFVFNSNQQLEIVNEYPDGTKKKLVIKDLQKVGDEEPSIKIDKDGKVVAAKFKVGNPGDYLIGDSVVTLPQGAVVLLDEDGNEAKISYPSDKDLPSIDSSLFDGTEYSYTFINQDKKFSFGNGNVIEGIDRFSYDSSGYYTEVEGNFVINGELEIHNPGSKTYLDFLGEYKRDYEGSYISIDSGRVITGSKLFDGGPVVNFLEGNRYIPRIDSDDNFAMFAFGENGMEGIAEINFRSDTQTPVFGSLNGFATHFDTQAFIYQYEDGSIDWFDQGTTLAGVEAKPTGTPVLMSNHKGTFDNSEYVLANGDGDQIHLAIGEGIEWGKGTNPDYIETNVHYPGYPNVLKGFSQNYLYFDMQTPETFRQYFNGRVTLTDKVGTARNNYNLRRLADVLEQFPEDYFESLNHLDIVIDRSLAGYRVAGGYATHARGRPDYGEAHFAIDDLSTAIHELGHTYDFTRGDAFASEWRSLGYPPTGVRGNEFGGPSDGFAYEYGRSDWREDVATTVQMTFDPGYWTDLVTTNRNAPIYRGKLASLNKHGFITDRVYESIMDRAGIDSSQASLDKYIIESQRFVGRR